MKDGLIENEANVFALLLIMPDKFFKADMAKEIDMFDDKAIKIICEKYQVSIGMLIQRISLYNKLKK